MNLKIVYQNEVLTIRYPVIEDANNMLDYINELSKEKTFINYQGEQETLESETKYLESNLKKIKNKQGVMLLTTINDEIAGISSIEMGTKTDKHIGIFGISVRNKFRGQGVGKRLYKTLESESIKNLKDLEIIRLQVFATNGVACNWYEKLGFKREGLLPNGIKLKDGYADAVFMYKSVK